MEQYKSYFQYFYKLLSTPLFEIGGNTITFFSVFAASAIFFISLIFSRVLEGLVRKRLANRRLDRGIKGSIERFSRYLVIVVGLFIALDTVGVSLKSLAALGAVLMVGIGFGLQNITQNFISGIILLIERPVKQGDIIRVGEAAGRVVDIRVRSTIVVTRDDIALVIPNSKLVSDLVTNESFSEDRVRIHVRVGVAYGSDTEKVKEQLLKVAENHPHVLKAPKPDVIFNNFGDSSLEFDLRIWIEELWIEDVIMSEIRYAIDQAFRKNNIVIAFPQRDLHIKSYEAKDPFRVEGYRIKCAEEGV